LRQLWDQLLDALVILIDEGLAHGDLSPFNLLVHRGRLVLIDLPQVVDLVANPQGHAFLARGRPDRRRLVHRPRIAGTDCRCGAVPLADHA
jgi:serine/threonine-protein kinase RIO1